MTRPLDRTAGPPGDGLMPETSVGPETLMTASTPGAIPPPRRRRFRTYRLGDLRALHRRSAGRFSASPPNLQATLMTLASITLFCVMLTGIKHLGQRLPVTEILFLRQIVLTVLLTPFFLKDLGGALRTNHLGLQLSRGAFSIGSQMCYFVALVHLPFAEMTALGFSQVLFMTVLAVLILKERVDARRWVATGIGFLGVLVMLKPTGDGLNAYALMSILAALLVCGGTISIRMMRDGEATATILIYQTLVLVPAYLVPTIVWWVPPTREEWAVILLVGAVGTAAQWLFTRASQVGEAAALAPLEFTRLVFAVVFGYLVFAEVPQLSTLAGALIIMAATAYTVRRNSGRR